MLALAESLLTSVVESNQLKEREVMLLKAGAGALNLKLGTLSRAVLSTPTSTTPSRPVWVLGGQLSTVLRGEEGDGPRPKKPKFW